MPNEIIVPHNYSLPDHLACIYSSAAFEKAAAELQGDIEVLRAHVDRELKKAVAGKRGKQLEAFQRTAEAGAVAQAKVRVKEALKTAVEHELKKRIKEAEEQELGRFERVTADEVLAAALTNLKAA